MAKLLLYNKLKKSINLLVIHSRNIFYNPLKVSPTLIKLFKYFIIHVYKRKKVIVESKIFYYMCNIFSMITFQEEIESIWSKFDDRYLIEDCVLNIYDVTGVSIIFSSHIIIQFFLWIEFRRESLIILLIFFIYHDIPRPFYGFNF